MRAELKRFLNRGGRVLATGPSGAELLPEGESKAPGLVQPRLCEDDAGRSGGVGSGGARGDGGGGAVVERRGEV